MKLSVALNESQENPVFTNLLQQVWHKVNYILKWFIGEEIWLSRTKTRPEPQVYF